MRDEFRVTEQCTLGSCELGLVKSSLGDCGDGFVGCSLNTQEVGMAVDSIRAAVKVGDIAGQHLLVPPREVSLREMKGVGELDHLPEEVRPRSEAFDDSRYLLSSRSGTPEIIGGRGVSSSFGVFNDSDLGFVIAHDSIPVETQRAASLQIT